MATTIKLKNGSGAPAASDLVQGEPALDLTNNRLYSENSSGSVVEIGTNPTSLSINGTAITSTAAELNILDGVTATAAELNILDGVTATTAELNILDGVTSTAAELNVLDGVTAFVDEDDMSSNSATSIPSQQSVKAYVDSQTSGISSTLSGLSDTNVTSPADAALLFYDTGTSKWIDNVVSGDITIADTGVAAIGAGVIVNADVNASAAIDVSKTALTAGTGLTLTTNTLSVDASQTQITAVGTIATGTWQGTAIADAYVANDLTISGGTVDNSVIGGTTAAAGTFTNLTASGTLTLGGVAVTSTAAELNILDGVTSTAGELNLVDGSSAGTIVNSKAVIYGSSGEVNATTLQIAGTSITSTAAELNILDGVTASTAELNILDGVTATTAELNYVDGVTSNIQTQLDAGVTTGKAIAMAIVFG